VRACLALILQIASLALTGWFLWARAINWLLAMQSEDGGWAAFDVDNKWAHMGVALRRAGTNPSPSASDTRGVTACEPAWLSFSKSPVWR
jgi:hypothetical protein